MSNIADLNGYVSQRVTWNVLKPRRPVSCKHCSAKHADHEGTLHLPKDFATIGVRCHVLGYVALTKMAMMYEYHMVGIWVTNRNESWIIDEMSGNKKYTLPSSIPKQFPVNSTNRFWLAEWGNEERQVAVQPCKTWHRENVTCHVESSNIFKVEINTYDNRNLANNRPWWITKPKSTDSSSSIPHKCQNGHKLGIVHPPST